MHDPVNNPEHYTSHPSGVECIQVAEHFGFCLGNALKYIWRADLKNDAIEDLEKAKWYIEREIKRRKNLLTKISETEDPVDLDAKIEEAEESGILDGETWRVLELRPDLDEETAQRFAIVRLRRWVLEEYMKDHPELDREARDYIKRRFLETRKILDPEGL